MFDVKIASEAEFQFHARDNEYSHFLVIFLSGSCCKNIWHDYSPVLFFLFCLPIICRRIFPNIHTCPLVRRSIRTREQWARADDDDCGKSPGPGPYLQRLSRWSVMLSRGSPLHRVPKRARASNAAAASRTIINQKKSLQKITFAAWWHF